MSERMKIFWLRYNNLTDNSTLTSDPILEQYKFTNVYRSTDRVSQYLIKNVIYSDNYSEKDLLLRVILFKIFNRIDTWEYIESRVGSLSYNNFNVNRISEILTERIKYRPIFSPAYLMTGSHSKYNEKYKYKHEKWLSMLSEEILRANKIESILKCHSLEELFNVLSRCSFIGPFLAYQYAIDLNYTHLFDFSENSFVKAGIGAKRGILKCFSDLGKYTFEDAIRFTKDNYLNYLDKYSLEFKNLFGREPTLIDFQNCFCETDKYLRVKMPELSIKNKRIKQKFKMNDSNIDYFFPPKWNLNNSR